ncbi:PucR family transcriptional regulator [Paenibacillus methanolicus]|uniref:Carbohydrate diacid regulator n=1 Tax=Paenibacillus methanolicus TaxID=582686 RepID=A0A5S5BPV6_9BACL|nr:PucR family transcriptional regulator [Paenibacillus methanolicus]TYP69215.1 carbohydrate diacid regulator [Paenibacillus methanolicus]
MSEANWIGQLEQILLRPIRQFQTAILAWAEQVSVTDSSNKFVQFTHNVTRGDWIRLATGELQVVISIHDEQVQAIEVSDGTMSDTEIRLLGWSLQHLKAPEQNVFSGLPEGERVVRELGSWIANQLDHGNQPLTVPDRLISRIRLYSTMIPFLLVADQLEPGQASYGDLEKLLRSFLSEDILLIPLKDQEWLILGPVSLIREAQNEDRPDEDEESVEDSLASIASGLHDMLASEWLGESHLAVLQPIQPAKDIVSAASQLRETVHLGRTFHVGSNIHLPWLLQLEWLLSAIPELQRQRFVEQALKRTDVFLEPEILSTLETFFSLDCNVSETAKKLYIHRNTLLYRLDKLKQETELDVRQFRDAVLVKIVLLLYKVTKRN